MNDQMCHCECHSGWQRPCTVPGGCGHLHDLTRCRAGKQCREGEVLRNDQGEPTGRLGAALHPADNQHLCGTCIQAAVVALRELPNDVVELTQRMSAPSMAVRYRDPDVPAAPRVKKPSPMLIDEYAFTLIELIDYECTIWAESVADAEGLEWDSTKAEHCRTGARVTNACTLLSHLLVNLIELPTQQQRAHSLTANPSDGHDPDRTTRFRGDYWSNREGWEAAVRIIDLHDRATRHIGRKPADGIQIPCPRCGERRLIREQHNDRVVCRDCRFALSDDDYDAFIDEALKSHGSPGDVLTRAQAAAMAGVKPTTIQTWVHRKFFRPLPSGGYRRVDIENFLATREKNFGEAS